MRQKLSDYAGRPALVTGAGGGIGRATSLALSKASCIVLAVDIEEATAKETAAACSGPAHAYRADVADPESVRELAEQVESEHGALGILVNNAGVGMSGAFIDT